jgi:hypothetical protein
LLRKKTIVTTIDEEERERCGRIYRYAHLVHALGGGGGCGCRRCQQVQKCERE